MQIPRRIAQTCRNFECIHILLLLLTAMVLYVITTNIYFLASRHSQLWPKTIYRISLYTIQSAFFVWRLWEIRKIQNSWYDIFMWVLFSYAPIMMSDTILELILYFTIGKDLSNHSKVPNDQFPGTESNMISMYFQLYFASFFMTVFAQIGYIVARIMNCRNGTHQNFMTDEELQQQIQQKINANSLPFDVSELADKECSICQGELAQNEILVKLNCMHIFHKECISQWLLRTNREYGQLKCPNCRAELTG